MFKNWSYSGTYFIGDIMSLRRIEISRSQQPKLALEGNEMDILINSSSSLKSIDTDFGAIIIGGSLIHTYTILNRGY